MCTPTEAARLTFTSDVVKDLPFLSSLAPTDLEFGPVRFSAFANLKPMKELLAGHPRMLTDQYSRSGSDFESAVPQKPLDRCDLITSLGVARRNSESNFC